MVKPVVAVGSLGGTITRTSDTGTAVSPTMRATELVAYVPGLGAVASLRAATLALLPGASLGYADVLAALAWARGAVDDGAEGVVIVQGTDTLEETAYLLDLYWDRSAPLVVSSAMRAPQRAGSDGPANLLAAVVTAADRSARDHGVVVVMNDEIHAAARVCKGDSMAVDAFCSPVFGPLGRVIEGQPVWANRPPRAAPLPQPQPPRNEPRVALVATHLADPGDLLTHLADAEYEDAAVAAMGVGHVPLGVAEAISKVAERLPVVFATRAGAGPTALRSYSFPGSETDLIRRGAVPAGWLTPVKARLLLWALLRQGTSSAQIGAEFTARGGVQRTRESG